MIRWFFRLLGFLSLLLIGAFLCFIFQLLGMLLDEDFKTDAIVVLTGGTGRVERALIVLSEGGAPILFISGVGEKVTQRQMLLAHAQPHIRARIAQREPEIIFDYVASSTRSNADQTAEFVRENNIRSIRLITSNYHMPRSMLEFRLQMPKVKIVADPVLPADTSRMWWDDKPSRKLVFSEFGKYLAALVVRNRPE